MQLMLGELPIQDGQIVMHGSISYAGEKPWLFSGTIRNNILFGQTFDRNYYDKVIKIELDRLEKCFNINGYLNRLLNVVH